MYVLQNNGTIEQFNSERISSSLIKETGCGYSFSYFIAQLVEQSLKNLDIRTITGPLIREMVCVELLNQDKEDLRRKYTRVGMPVFDAERLDNGAGKGDNANLQMSPETIHKRKADLLSKEQYLLSLPKHLTDLHLNGDIHIGDLEYFSTRQFCLDTDIRFFFYYGLVCDGTGEHTSYAKPAKRPEVAILHLAKILCASQVSCAGGQGIYNFLTFLAPFFEGEPYDTYKQCMQMFVYEMTQMLCSRAGQTVFSSVQLSPGIPEMWNNIPIVYNGKIWNGNQAPLKTYGEFESENRLLFKALMEVMIEGDGHGKPFYFPKPEISIEPQFIEHLEEENVSGKFHIPTYKELYLLAFELASKFGTPYFDNQIPPYRNYGKGISCMQCCSYCFNSNPETDDTFENKINFKDGAHFSMGSYQVITLNLPRYSYKSKNYIDFVKICKDNINKIIELFKIKKQYMERNIKNDTISFLTQKQQDPNDIDKLSPTLVDFDNLVYTIGIVGLNEVVKTFTGKWLHESIDAQKLGIKICIDLKKYCKEMSEKHGITIAFARTPAETTAQRFAVLDMNKFENFICQGDLETAKKNYSITKDLPIYYTNGTHISPNANIMIAEKIRIEQAFFPVLDGGNICHIWLGERRPDPRGLMDITLKLCKTTNLGYFAFTRDFTTRTKFYKMYEPKEEN